MKKILVLGALSLFGLGSSVSAANKAGEILWPLRRPPENVGFWKAIEVERDAEDIGRLGPGGEVMSATYVTTQRISPETVTGEEQDFTLRGLNEEETMSALSVIADRNQKATALSLYVCQLEESGVQKVVEIIQKSPDLEDFDFTDRGLDQFGFSDGYLSENGAKCIFDALFNHPKIRTAHCGATKVSSETRRLLLDFGKMLASIKILNSEWQRLLEIKHPGLNLEKLQGTFSSLVQDIRRTRDFARNDDIKKKIVAFIDTLPEEKFDNNVNDLIHVLKCAFKDILNLGKPYLEL